MTIHGTHEPAMSQSRESGSADERGRSGGVLRGEVVYLYAFDVANEIRLDRAAELLPPRPVSFAVRTHRTIPRFVSLSRPLAIEPPAPTANLFGAPPRLLVRVYEVGVVSVTARVAVAADGPLELIPYHNPVLDDGRPLDDLARDLCDGVLRDLGEALVRPGPVTDPEAYTAFYLSDLGTERDANRWLADRRREVAGLLTETPPEQLSDAQVD